MFVNLGREGEAREFPLVALALPVKKKKGGQKQEKLHNENPSSSARTQPQLNAGWC